MGVIKTPNFYKALTFDGVSSRNYGVYITGEAVFNAPARDVEMISIPGRNGAFALDHGRFENIEVTYPAGIFAENEEDFAKAVSDFRNYLCSRPGYCRLTDEYNSDEYRLAVYKSGLEVSPAQLIAGEFNITFDCKPQRFLTSGEEIFSVGTWGEVEEYSGDIVTFTADDSDALKKCEVDINPIQSLNGYSSPWVGGAGKNIFDYDTWKTVGTYHGTSVFENNGITITATSNDCYTQYSSSLFPESARIPISEGETITLAWEENTNASGGCYIFPNGTTTGMSGVNNSNAKKVSYTATSGITYVTIRMGVANSGTTISYKNIQIIKGTTVPTWTPYSNICPISGRASVDTYRSGDNLINTSTNESGAIDASGNEVVNASFNRTQFIEVTPSSTIYVCTSLSSGYVIRVHGYNASGTWVQQLTSIATNGNANAVTDISVPSTVSKVRISYPLVGVSNTFLYNGQTYTTTLGTTVYGGTLDVVSGELSNDFNIYTIGSSSNIGWNSGGWFWVTDLTGKKIGRLATTISSAFTRWTSNDGLANMPDGYFREDSTTATIYFKYNQYANDIPSVKTALEGQTFVCEKATPTTTTLTAQQINALLGTNNVWSSGGAVDIEVGHNPYIIFNPTNFDSLPLIKVKGTGTLVVGSTSAVITGTATQVIYIDCQAMEAYQYSGGVIISANNLVSFSTLDFPELSTGNNTITVGTGLSEVEITPRWWRV